MRVFSPLTGGRAIVINAHGDRCAISSLCFYNVLKRLGGVPEWLKGADCKSAGYAYVGSNPTSSTINPWFFVYSDQRMRV